MSKKDKIKSKVVEIEATPYTTPSGVYKGEYVTYQQRLKEIDRKKALKNIKEAVKKSFGDIDLRKTGLFR
tara:strand:+ start:707 stop:916 length:210 start_codon:yes stop_codon:yes gene_type:complete